MAITANAKKAHRASLKKHIFNLRRKRVVTSTVKDVRKQIIAGKSFSTKGEATEALSAAFKALDKAAKTGVIKKNTASRKKSRLAKAIAKAGAKA
jgi:small subunit ribosomal protein S20